MKHIFILILAALAFASCRQTEYITVPVKEVHTEYIHDSIYHTDTIERFNNTFNRGDTIIIHDSIVIRSNSNSSHRQIVHDTVADTAALLSLTKKIDDQSASILDYQNQVAQLNQRLISSRRAFAISAILCALLLLPWIINIIKRFRYGS